MHARPIVLLAASGLAREVMAALEASDRPVQAVLDDDLTIVGKSLRGIPVTGPIDSAPSYPDSDLIVCAGSGRARRAIVERLETLGVGPERYTSVVHQSAAMGAGCRPGNGSVILAGVAVTADVALGRHVICMPNAVLTHDCSVGDYGTICAGAVLGGSVRIGTAAYVGMSASIRERVSVGDGSVLGMGSVLLRDLPADAVWAGVPAGPLPKRSEGNRESALVSTKENRW